MAATHITPFLILNIGSEMIYVFAQRLDAQKIEKEKATVGTSVFINNTRLL